MILRRQFREYAANGIIPTEHKRSPVYKCEIKKFKKNHCPTCIDIDSIVLMSTRCNIKSTAVEIINLINTSFRLKANVKKKKTYNIILRSLVIVI